MKIIAKTLLAGITAMSLISACGDMESTHEKYSGRPEIIYLGRVDSLRAHGGLNRIMLSWYMNADPKIDSTVVYWNFGRDSMVKRFVRTKPGLQKDSIFIDGLTEGNFNFEVFNRNNQGLFSLPRTISGTTYGNAYIAGLRRRSISAIAITPDQATQTNTVKITWGDADASNIYSEIVYTKKSTAQKERIFVSSKKDISNQPTVTEFDDIANVLGDEDSMFDIICYYRPESKACDTIPKVFTDQIMTYLATGSRVQYTGGTPGAPIAWTSYGKILRRVNDSTYDCNFIGGWGTNTINLFRLTINEDNTVNMVGYYANYSWTLTNTPGTTSTYDPVTKTFDVKYKVITDANGNYTEIQEVLSPRY